MNYKISRKIVTSLLATIIYVLFIIPINENINFYLSDTTHKSIILSYFLKILFSFFLFYFFMFILNFIDKIKNKDQYYLNWLKISSIYLFIMLVIFILIYPGHWVGDEFQILDQVKHYSLTSWQNYFTNIYYTFCLYIIPSGIGIPIIQIILASTIVGYIISKSQMLFKRKNLSYLLLLPFLFFPIILNNFYPLRLTIYSYLEVLLLSKIILLYVGKIKRENKYIDLLEYSFLITILSFWRTEGIFYLLLFPIILILLKIPEKIQFKNSKKILYIIPSIAIFTIGFMITYLTSNPKYQVASTINPLSTMLQNKLYGDNIENTLEDIGKYIDINTIKKYPSYNEIPSFWNGAVKDSLNQANLKEYNNLFLYIITNNLGYFIENRVCLFLSTNSLAGYTPLSTSQFYNNDPAVKEILNDFYRNNIFSKPLNLDVKLFITKHLLLIDNNNHSTLYGIFVWNIIPTISILLILEIYLLITKRYFWAFIIIPVIIRVIIVFLTAPANYFMYYLPVYMSGNFLISLLILKKIDHVNNKQID